MFILRRITKNNQELNLFLGDHYNLVLEEQEEPFKNTIKNFYGNIVPPEQLHGFIISNNGTEVQPIFKYSSYYIMTENGKTFANISFNKK